jgi:asparagine synthase (glutamine-hydrolysing)
VQQNPDLMSFNIYFADKSFSEREEASLVAKHLGTRHVEKEVTADVVHLIPELVNIFDEPFGDDSMIPTYYLNKMAREKMTVALSGDGGDELFAGYPTYLADRAAQIYRHLPAFVRDRAIEPLVNALPVSHNRISLDYKAKAFIRAAHRPSPLEHFGWTEIFDHDAKRILYSAAFREKLRARPLAESYVKAYAEAGRREGIERFLYVDQKTHLLDEFLVKVDRLSMAHSLEVRPPFLDHRLVEWAAEIPMNYKLRGISTKDILRKLMKRRLPDSILTGAKKGFSPPMAKWLSGDLLPYIQKKFSPDHIRNNPYLNPEGPMEFLDEHVNKKANNARRLWTLLMFVEWYDRKVLG